MKKTIVIFVVGLLTQQITQAQGTTYLSNLGQSSVGSDSVESNSWLAVAFQTGANSSGYTLNSIQLGMLDATGNPNGFTAMIYSAIAGGFNPNRSHGTLNGSLSPTTAGVYIYTAPANLTLLPLDEYLIVLTSGTAVADGAYQWSLAGVNSYNRSGGWIGRTSLFYIE